MTLLVFEPHHGGHQATYARHLLRGWARRRAPGSVVLLAQERLLDDLAGPLADSRAIAVPLRPDEVPAPQRGLANAIGWGRMGPLRRALGRHPADHVLAMSFEALAGPLARRARLPGSPTLGALAFHTGADVPPSLRTAVRDGLLGAALRHPALRTLYTVDPSAPPRIRAMGTTAEIVAVPDPIPDPVPVPPPSEVRRAWGIEDGRRLAILTGTLDGRKGAECLLSALLLLDEGTAGHLAVVLAGRVAESLREPVAAGIAAVRRETAVQIVHRPGFVSDADLAALTAAADLVLLPYPGQVGSSGFLMAAAAAGTPVLTQETGLMAWLTRSHGLGQTVDTRAPEAVAEGLRRAVAAPGVGVRPDAAAAFAAAHTPDAFAAALLDPILGPAT